MPFISLPSVPCLSEPARFTLTPLIDRAERLPQILEAIVIPYFWKIAFIS